MRGFSTVSKNFVLKFCYQFYEVQLTYYVFYHLQQKKATPEGVYLPISKLHSILVAANLNNISQICYCGQILLQSAALTAVFMTI